MIEVKNTPEGILVNVSGNAMDVANEIRLLTNQIIKHPQLNVAFKGAIYLAGGLEFITDLVDDYDTWIKAIKIVNEKEAGTNVAR